MNVPLFTIGKTMELPFAYGGGFVYSEEKTKLDGMHITHVKTGMFSITHPKEPIIGKRVYATIEDAKTRIDFLNSSKHQ